MPAINGVNGSGDLAVFTFDAIGKGTSTIGIQAETMVDSYLNIISGTTTVGAVTVIETSKVPEIDPGSPMNALTLLLGGVAVTDGRRSQRESVPHSLQCLRRSSLRPQSHWRM